MPQSRLSIVRVVCLAQAILLASVAGGRGATRIGVAALESASASVAALPSQQHATAVAAHVSQEGHWTLVNAAGEAFTAATPDELKRGWNILLPDLAAAGGKPAIYLTADTVLMRRERLADLPKDAQLWFADASASTRLVATDAGRKWLTAIKPALFVELGDAAAYRETLTLLARPLDRSHFRLLALEPGGPHILSSSLQVDRAQNRPLVDAIDPDFLLDAVARLRAQTALIVGRFEGDALAFKPAATSERSMPWRQLTEAATASDVNLLVFKSTVGQQPGGRNWLWQKFEVKGLDEALSRATLADAFDALGGPDAPLAVTTTLVSADRTVLDVHPATGLPASSWTSARLGGVLTDAMSGLAGKVRHEGALAQFRSAARQAELDRRLLPYVPSWLQWGYGVLLLLGLLGWPVAARWWGRIWPAERASEYGYAVGFWAARIARGVAFALLFLPAAALIAAPRALAAAVLRKGPAVAARM